MGQTVWPASSQAAMLALAALPGDYCDRSDLPGMFSLQAAPASSIANWQQITGQNQSAGGSELAAAVIATTGTASLTTSFVDIPGTAVAPVLGARSIYADVIGSFGATTATTIIVQLYDATAAAAICQQTLVTVAGATGLPFVMRARLSPGAGARAYKLRWATGAGTTTGAYYGSDLAQSTGLFIAER